MKSPLNLIKPEKKASKRESLGWKNNNKRVLIAINKIFPIKKTSSLLGYSQGFYFKRHSKFIISFDYKLSVLFFRKKKVIGDHNDLINSFPQDVFPLLCILTDILSLLKKTFER